MTNFNIYGTGDANNIFISAGKVRSGLTFVGQMPKFKTLATKDNEFTR